MSGANTLANAQMVVTSEKTKARHLAGFLIPTCVGNYRLIERY